ncbi:MAG: DUF4832 domain-containing protein [Planctomycetes bacterium]|nr:DUF4832 domain-containing protein [Planctomycetota bacterium]
MRRCLFQILALFGTAVSLAAADEAAIEAFIREDRHKEAIEALRAAADIPAERAAPVKCFLESTFTLRKAVFQQNSLSVPFSDRILGQPARGRIIAADESGFTVDFGVTKTARKWHEISPVRLVRIAVAAAPDSGVTLAAAYRVASAAGDGKLTEELAAAIKAVDPALMSQAERPCSMTFSDVSTAEEESGPKAVVRESSAAKPVIVHPEEDPTRILRLPDCGWLSRTSAGYRAGFLEMANVVYNRQEWRDWHPDGGAPLKMARGWMDGKRYFAFRVMANRHDSLPEPLQKIIPSVTKDDGRVIPMYWDQSFIDEHKKLIDVIGKQVGNHPYLSYVDIGAVGDTGGEWVLYGDRNKMGLTPDRADHLVWSFVRMYRAAFPRHVRLYLATAAFGYARNQQDLVEYCAENNIGRRLDGLCGQTTEENFWAKRYKEFWKETPFQWEGAYTTLEWEKDGPWDTAKVLEAGLEYGPSYITYADSHVDGENFAKTKTELLQKYGAKLGYRFVVREAAYSDAMSPGRTYNLLMVVENKGCARCYADREVEISFLGSGGRVEGAVRAMPAPGTSKWLPGEPLKVAVQFKVPGLASGNQILAVALLDDHPMRPNNRLDMGMKVRTKDNRYVLGKVNIR